MLGKIQEEKKIPPKVETKIMQKSEKSHEQPNWNNLTISQDDLWFLYRLKFGKGTRIKRKELLPKFTEVFNKNLKYLTRDTNKRLY